jgi:antitoxin YefM
MIEISYTEFEAELSHFLNEVEKNNKTIAVRSDSGSGTVLISQNEYNSMMETMHLLGSRTNAQRLYQSIKQMKKRTSQM